MLRRCVWLRPLLHCCLMLSLLLGGQTALAASQQLAPTVAAAHCSESTSHSNPTLKQIPAADCLAHCALPAPRPVVAHHAPFAAVWPQRGNIQPASLTHAPPSPPPKTFSV